MQKKEYIIPELSLVRFTLRDTICSSPEGYNEFIDSTGDWDDPIIPEDPGIDW